MPVRFTFEVEGKKEFDRAFNRVLPEHISDWIEIWKKVNEWFEDYTIRQFYSEGAKGGSGQWKPLSAKYEAYKEIKFPFMPINRRTDKLFRSLKGKTSDSIIEMRAGEFVRGTSLSYAKYVQAARPIISFTESDRRSLMKTIQRALVPIVRKAGFVETELSERVG